MNLIPKVAFPYIVDAPEDKKALYRNAIQAVGMELVETKGSLDGFDGLLMPGGPDNDPAAYSALPHPKTGPLDPRRDKTEPPLIREAIARNLATLLICRAEQMLAIIRHGTLKQHINNHMHEGKDDVHPVTIMPGTKLSSILCVDRYPVNSLHHQCVDEPGDGVVVSARAPDGTIEGIELVGKSFVVGVQWHPERRPNNEIDARLFRAFRNVIQPGLA